MRQPRFCSAPQCQKRHYATGYCKKHYTQAARHGRLTPDRERGIITPCAAPNCDRLAETSAEIGGARTRLCRKHRHQIAAHGRLTPEREHLMGNIGCKSPGCLNKHRARGFCTTHYNQQRWAKLKRLIQRAKEAGAL